MIEPAIAAMHGQHGFSILVTIGLYTMMLEVCRWLINEKLKKIDISSTNQ